MLHRRGSAEVLALVRIVVFGIWLYWLHAIPFERLALVKDVIFEGAGPWLFIPKSVITVEALVVFRWGLTILLVMTIFGVRPFIPFAVASTTGILLFDGLMKSVQGSMNHSQFSALYAVMIVSVFPAGDAFSILGRYRGNRSEACYAAPMLACAIMLTLTYVLVGAKRFQVGGLEIFTNDAIVTYTMLRAADHGLFSFTYGLDVVAVPLLIIFLKAGFFVTTIAEVASPLVLLNVWLRRAWFAIIIPFHVLTLLLMNILFWENLLLALVFLTGLPYLLAQRSKAPHEAQDAVAMAS